MRPGPDKIVLDMLLSLKANLLDAEQDDLWLDLLLDTPEAEIIKIRTHFRANPPAIKAGYPRRTDKWPLWAVILASKDIEADYIGKSGGGLSSGPDEPPEKEQFAMSTDQAVMIACHAQGNADVCREHSLIVTAAILSARDYLVSQGVDGYGFQGMEDLAPQQGYLPDDVFVRGQTWSFVMSEGRAIQLNYEIFDGSKLYVGLKGVDVGDGHIGAADYAREL